MFNWKAGTRSAPELFAVPVDRWMCFHFDVATDFCLAGEPNVFAFVAEYLDSQQWVDPFEDGFKKTLPAAVFRSFADNHVATAAVAKAHAVQDLVRTLIQLDTVLLGHRANVFTLSDVDADLLFDKVDVWHGTDFRSVDR